MGAAFCVQSLVLLAASSCYSVMLQALAENVNITQNTKNFGSSPGLEPFLPTFRHPSFFAQDVASIISASVSSLPSASLLPWQSEIPAPFRINHSDHKSSKNPDSLSQTQDKFESFFPGIRENFSSALENYFKRYAKYYSTQDDVSYYRDVSSLYDLTPDNEPTRNVAEGTATSIFNDISFWPGIFITKSSAADVTKKTVAVSNNPGSDSSYVMTMNIMSSAEVGVTSLPPTNEPDKVVEANEDPDEIELMMTRFFIKPSPTQKLNGTETLKPEMHKDVVSESSKKYRTEDIIPTHEFTRQNLDSQATVTKVTSSLDVLEHAAVDKKTPELKSSMTVISLLTIDPVLTNTPQNPTVTYEPETRTSAVEKDISATTSLISIHDNNGNNSDVGIANLAPETSPKEEDVHGLESCFWNQSACFRHMVNLTLSMSWIDFCSDREQYVENLTDKMVDNISTEQLVFVDRESCGGRGHKKGEIMLSIYVRDESGRYDRNLTGRLRKRIHPRSCRQRKLCEKITNYHLEDDEELGVTVIKENHGIMYLSHPGVIAGACVCAALCIVVILGLMRLMRHRSMSASLEQDRPGPRRTSRSGRSSVDAHSLASFTTGQRKRQSRISLRSFLNHAFEDPEMPSRPLNLNNLTNILTNKLLLEEEFKKLPVNMPLPDSVPAGAETKNRYSNVIPISDTRVLLTTVTPRNEVTEYINANYVRGYKGNESEYLACQAPLPDTVEDFWRMIWEQQSRMILMLTQLQENGTQRCAPYFPENTLDCQRLYGDFQVSLQNKDVREHYTVSTLRLYEMEKNLFRDIIHMWYRSWPPHGVPSDHAAVLAFLAETKKHSQRTMGPVVVHCSPGTGRTGTVICLDWCTRQYDDMRSVDIPRAVFKIRQDRAGAVQTLEQYVFIHEVLQEYAVKMGSQSHRPSIKSFMSFKLNH